MKRSRNSIGPLTVSLVLLVIAGCAERKPPPRILPGDFLTFEIGGRQIRVELAFDEPSRRQGLMRRTTLPEDQGMLFLHPDKEERSFWMKNTPLPLSIAFIDDDGKILQIEHMEPKDETHTLSKNKVRYALEMNQGWFRKAGVGVGDRLEGFRAKVNRVPIR